MNEFEKRIEELEHIVYNHKHQGFDSTAPLGYVLIPIVSAAPTGTAKQGTLLYDQNSNKFYLYNDGWKFVQFS